jgi:hypothetical protein
MSTLFHEVSEQVFVCQCLLLASGGLPLGRSISGEIHPQSGRCSHYDMWYLQMSVETSR